MQNSLDQLARRERELCDRVRDLTGSIEEQTAVLEKSGTFRAYAKVFTEYVALCTVPDLADEALARATFLLWYDCVGPACVSGMRGLPDDARAECLKRLDRRIADGTLPDELRWQLAYYFWFADFAFAPRDGLAHLQEWFASSDPSGWEARVRRRTMSDRGQLGEYWSSVGASPAL